MLFWNIIVILALLLIFLTVVVGVTFAPWVPTRKKDLQRVLALANLKSGEKCYELGCGNGRVSFFLAKNSEAKIIGVEYGILLFLWCTLKKLFSRNSNLSFRYQNLFHTDLSDADVVYVFGMPKKLETKLRHKFITELLPGSRVISYIFPIQGWEPSTVDLPSEGRAKIYHYVV